jgi:hypothetical protein
MLDVQSFFVIIFNGLDINASMRRDTQGLSFIHHPVDPVSFLSTDG